MIISLSDYLKIKAYKQYKQEDLSDSIIHNINTLLSAVNPFLEEFLKQFPDFKIVGTSGYRDEQHSIKEQTSLTSNHCKGLALDISDPLGIITEFAMNNLELLEKHGLYIEHPYWTKGWLHLQTPRPKSGNRAFYPQVHPPKKSYENIKYITKLQPAKNHLQIAKQENITENTVKIISNNEDKIDSNMKIADVLNNKGFDVVASFVPGGALIKSIAQSLLGNENASEKEIAQAIESSDKSTVENILKDNNIEYNKLILEVKKEEEETKQAIEITKQKDADVLIKKIEANSHMSGKEKILIGFSYQATVFGWTYYYSTEAFNKLTSTQHSVIGLFSLLSLMFFTPYVGGGVFDKIINSISDIFIKGIEGAGRVATIPATIIKNTGEISNNLLKKIGLK